MYKKKKKYGRKFTDEEKEIMEHQQEYTKRIIALREKIKADNLKKRTSVNRNILEYNQYNKKLNN